MLPRQTSAIAVAARASRGGGQRRVTGSSLDADRPSTIQVTIVITIAPPSAVQKPSTWKPMSSCSASQPVSISISALITQQEQPEGEDDERERQELDDRLHERR